MVSVGSSHSALTSGEDNEEASLLGCPPIGLLDEEEFSSMPPRNQARDRALYPRPKTPRLYGPPVIGTRMLHAEITGEESKPMPRRTVFLISMFLCLFASMPAVQAQLPPAKKDPLSPARSAQGKEGCSTTEASSCAQAAAKILPIVMGSSPMEENLRRLTDEVGGRVTGTPEMAKAVE